MNKKIFYILIPFILGCNFLFPPADATPAAFLTQPAAATPARTESTAEAELTTAFSIVRINKKDGALLNQLALQVKTARELNQTPILEFDATWCPPCIAIEDSLQNKDAITLTAYANIYLIRADVDEWGWGDGENFNFEGIPIYYKLDEHGKPTGATIDGGAWGENIPKNFAPVLDNFFHTP